MAGRNTHHIRTQETSLTCDEPVMAVAVVSLPLIDEAHVSSLHNVRPTCLCSYHLSQTCKEHLRNLQLRCHHNYPRGGGLRILYSIICGKSRADTNDADVVQCFQHSVCQEGCGTRAFYFFTFDVDIQPLSCSFCKRAGLMSRVIGCEFGVPDDLMVCCIHEISWPCNRNKFLSCRSRHPPVKNTCGASLKPLQHPQPSFLLLLLHNQQSPLCRTSTLENQEPVLYRFSILIELSQTRFDKQTLL